MGRVPHSWQEAYKLAFTESDPAKVMGRVEYALIAIERRYSEWGTDPGTPAELRAIQKCISALQRRLKQKLPVRRGTVVPILSGQPHRQRSSA